TIDMELPFAVQTRAPSNAIPFAGPPRFVATVVTAPAGCAGSIVYSRPGLDVESTTTRPIPERTSQADEAPVQVSSSLPPLARTRGTRAAVEEGTKRSAPSEATP